MTLQTEGESPKERGLVILIDQQVQAIIKDIRTVQRISERNIDGSDWGRYLVSKYHLDHGFGVDGVPSPKDTLHDHFVQAAIRRGHTSSAIRTALLLALIYPEDQQFFTMPVENISGGIDNMQDRLLDESMRSRSQKDYSYSWARYKPDKEFVMKLRTTIPGVDYNLEITQNRREYLEIKSRIDFVGKRILEAGGKQRRRHNDGESPTKQITS